MLQPVAILAPLIAFLGRQVGRIVQMAFGWATILLFGRVPQRKQLLLAGVALGSVLWVVALIGVLLPEAGTFLVALVPAPDAIGERWIRLAMLVLAVVLPLAVGAGGLLLMDAGDRPNSTIGKLLQVLRGYPYAGVLSMVILLLLVVAPIFKLRTIVKRWEDAHIPIVVQPNGYEKVANDLEAAVDASGLNLSRARAPRILEIPSRLLAVVGGQSVRRLVPDRLVMLRGRGLEVTVYPSDVAMAGSKDAVARARAAVADRLTTTDAYLTASEEAQRIEDVLRDLRGTEDREASVATLAALDKELASLTVPYEEWEVLYRQRLQVERDLLRARAVHPEDRWSDSSAGSTSFLGRMIQRIKRLVP